MTTSSCPPTCGPATGCRPFEGDIDTVHTLYLHLGLTQYEDAPEGSWAWWHLQNRAPHYAAIDTDFGTMYGAYRPAMEGMNYWRFANFLMPFYAMTPPGVLGLEHKFRAWVPMDDTHTLAISSNQRSPLFGPNGERPKGSGRPAQPTFTPTAPASSTASAASPTWTTTLGSTAKPRRRRASPA